MEKEKEELQLSSTTEAAGVTEMQTKLQAAVKALEAQRAVNRDLEVGSCLVLLQSLKSSQEASAHGIFASFIRYPNLY